MERLPRIHIVDSITQSLLPSVASGVHLRVFAPPAVDAADAVICPLSS